MFWFSILSYEFLLDIMVCVMGYRKNMYYLLDNIVRKRLYIVEYIFYEK